jgi:3-oxoacyl-[acyl-carrier protein] reductase
MNTTQEKPLAGKVALVTRGSRGIGAAIARRLAADAVNVYW